MFLLDPGGPQFLEKVRFIQGPKVEEGALNFENASFQRCFKLSNAFSN